MATLDKEAIKDVAKGAADALRQAAATVTDSADTPDLKNEVDQLLESLQQQYGETRKSARQEIAGFLNELKAIDPALPKIVAETATAMTRRKGRGGLWIVGFLMAVVAVVVVVARQRGPVLR